MSNTTLAFLEKFKGDFEKMKQSAPDMVKGFGGLFQSIMKDGALKKKEKRYSLSFLFLATPFFMGGVAFAYWLLPIAIEQIMGLTPTSLSNLIRFDEYLVFVLKLFLVFGIAFELPVFLLALNLMNIVSGRAMLKPWRYVDLESLFFRLFLFRPATPSQCFFLRFQCGFSILPQRSLASCTITGGR